ncbi:MAG: gliding motility-associated C-terminal domain-containing protein [Flavobacteriales bacterium]|nr:gliding motility-associated C-terminal domain-containing protein [Flavobacteriales bacterium]
MPHQTPIPNTQYMVLVIDDNGCQTQDTVNISMLPTPIALAGFDVIVCPGNSVQLNAVGGVAYSWSPDSTLVNANMPNPTASPSATTDYIVTVFDLNGCSGQDTLKVTVQDSIVAIVGGPVGICLGDSVDIFVSGGATYLWSPTAGLNNPNIANPKASPLVTTWYTVNVSSGTCGDIDSVQVIVNPPPTAEAGPDVTICKGDTAILTASGASTFIWSTTETTASISVYPDSTTIYAVSVSDFIGCSDSDLVTVNVKDAPTIIAGADIAICLGDAAVLTATGGNTYTWSTGDPGSLLTVTPTDTTAYSVTGFDIDNCWGTDTVTVNVIPQPIAKAGLLSSTGCAPLDADFINTSTPNDSSLRYAWNFGDPFSGPLNTDSMREPSHTYMNAGTYTVNLTISHDVCSGSDTMSTDINVVVSAIPNAAISASPEEVSVFDPVVYVSDISSGGASCILIFANGDTLPLCEGEFSINDTGLITITQIVSDGLCTDTAYDYVYVKPEYIFFAPNSFSPNGDGNNDLFYGQGVGIKHYKMSIYNRWGDLIFESIDPSIHWSGTANKGKEPIQQDVYVYVFEIIDFRNLPHTYVGHVTVIR